MKNPDNKTLIHLCTDGVNYRWSQRLCPGIERWVSPLFTSKEEALAYPEKEGFLALDTPMEVMPRQGEE